MGKREGKKSFGLGVDGKIILKYFSEKWNGEWTGLIWLSRGRGSRLL
jgi:hypothetical protein